MALTKLEKLQLRTKLSLSAELDIIASLASSGPVEFGKIIQEIGLRGHAIVSFVLVLPFLQPVPLVGVSTVVGLVIGLLGLLLAFNLPPRLPARFARKSVSPETLLRVVDFGHRMLIRVERLIRPRGIGFLDHPIIRVSSAMIISICGILLALPLPIPFSNAIPSWTVAIVSLGVIERDGLLLGLGYTLFLVTVIFFAALVLLPILGFNNQEELLKGLGL